MLRCQQLCQSGKQHGFGEAVALTAACLVGVVAGLYVLQCWPITQKRLQSAYHAGSAAAAAAFVVQCTQHKSEGSCLS